MNHDVRLINGLLTGPEEECTERLKQVRLINHRFDSKNKAVYEFIEKHIEKYEQPPSQEVLKDKFPAFSWKDPEDPFDFIVEKALEEKNRNQLKEILADVENAMLESPGDARNLLIQKAREFEIVRASSSDIHIVESYSDWEEEYKKIRDSGEVRGLSTGLEIFDKLTNGIQDGDFWILAARPKMLKTWLLCYMFATAGMECADCNILLFSKEMTKTQIQQRIHAIIGKLNYNALRKYELSDKDLEELNRTLQERIVANMIIVGKGEYENFDAKYIRSKIVEYDPRVCYVDGLYLFEESPSWEDQTSMTRSIRQISLETDVPIIGTVQLNKKKEIAYSDSYLQDATAIIHQEREYDSIKEAYTNTLKLTMKQYREGESDIVDYVKVGFKNMTFVEGKDAPDPDGDESTDFLTEAVDGLNLDV